MADELPTSDLPDASAPATAPEATAETKPEAPAKPRPTAKPKGKAAAPVVADAPEAAAEDPAPEDTPAVDTSLPLFLVESKGLQSNSFHAVDESDAIRQFYASHKITDTASRTHKATRVS